MERIHHIATDHGPMAQGGLLTAHRGSVHRGGEAPGGQSSLRRGAGTASLCDPEIVITATAEQWKKSRHGALLEGFCIKRNK